MSLSTSAPGPHPSQPQHRSRRSVPAEVAVQSLEGQLANARRREILLRTLFGVVCAGTGILVAIAGIAAIDVYWEVPAPWRRMWLWGTLLFAASLSLIGWRRWVGNYGLRQVARDAERRLTHFGQRLRTTLDYHEATPRPAAASPALLAEMHDETYRAALHANWFVLMRWRYLGIACLAASLLLIGLVASLVAVPEYRIAMGRAFLLPWEYTSVTYTPQASTVHVGDSVVIKVEITGRPVADPTIRYRDSGRQAEWKTLPLQSAAEDLVAPTYLSGEVTGSLENLRQDLEFEVLAGPKLLPKGSIRVLQPLTLESSRAEITPPAYTKQTAQNVETLDLKVLEGSRVDLRLNFNRTPLRVAIADSEVPVVIDGKESSAVLADLRASKVFRIDAETADGVSLDSLTVRIRVQPDRKPELQFVQPPEELSVTPSTEVPMIVDARDDLGLHKVGILYQIGDGPMQTLHEQDAEGATEPFRLSSMLMLEDHQVTFQDGVTYHAFAEDVYFEEIRRTTTPLRFIDIRPYKIAYQFLDNGGT